MKLRALPGWLSPLLIHILSVASSKPRSPSLLWKGCNRLRAWFTMCPDIIASAYGENLGVANYSKPIWLLYNTPLGYWTTLTDSWKFCQVVINTQICCSQISNDTVFQNAWLIFFINVLNQYQSLLISHFKCIGLDPVCAITSGREMVVALKTVI